jgi:hypothetical protein
MVICIFVEISTVYLDLQYPSDVTAGDVFEGVCLSENIVILGKIHISPNISHG